MANTRYGLKEVANVIFFDVATNKPVLFFDTLKVSSIENESESAEARGGQGNGRLMTWDFGRTATLTLQDALLSDVSLSLLAGNTVKTTDITVVGRETLAVKDVSGALEVELAETAIGDDVTVYKVDKGVMGEEIAGATVSGKKVTLEGATVTAGQSVMVFYEYTAPTGSTMVTFSGSKFPATYRVVGDTVVRGQDGVDRKMQFVIPKAKLQSTFNLTMDAENVSTFDFTLDVLVDAETNKLYDIIRL
ncbi:virion structural protein [Bacillus phage vB_BanS_Sophrita]|uniref:Structural protein n=1 Tax=Bacillus phage vB_BanS_Sophrita TaxID=2894790 RepID=A0AAE8YU20_9CAUD|nr:virion structural protein [Bacillus phage vB_BanS_Sophrita]UGO50803.1 putative structural protein [Bacillus phage vB_BanS_Sophrita]